MYGGEKGNYTNWFKEAEQGKVVVPGDGTNIIANSTYNYATIIVAQSRNVGENRPSPTLGEQAGLNELHNIYTTRLVDYIY